jgi:hypothetical protein
MYMHMCLQDMPLAAHLNITPGWPFGESCRHTWDPLKALRPSYPDPLCDTSSGSAACCYTCQPDCDTQGSSTTLHSGNSLYSTTRSGILANISFNSFQLQVCIIDASSMTVAMASACAGCAGLTGAGFKVEAGRAICFANDTWHIKYRHLSSHRRS